MAMDGSIFQDTMADMAWPAIEKAAAQGALVLLPTGVIEEHGPHLHLAVDIQTSHLLCRKVREILVGENIATLICPPFFWGINSATGAFPGSFTVRRETMTAVLVDILASLRRWGFKRVYNINWHADSDHNQALFDAFAQAVVDNDFDARCIITPFELKRYNFSGAEPHLLVMRDPPVAGPRSPVMDLHAGSLETAIVAAYFPRDLDAGQARQLAATKLTFAELGRWTADARKETPLGYLGDPAAFDVDTGREFVTRMAAAIAALIQQVVKKAPIGGSR